MNIPLTEVIAHRNLLTPRQAGALTLAVGRAWDRKRARLGDRPLPGVTQIELSDAGAVSFAEAPPDTSAVSESTLSGLLGQLLGQGGRVAAMKVPSSGEEGFRSALLHVADEDPGALSSVFSRIVAERNGTNADVAHAASRVGRGRRRAAEALAAAAAALLLSATSMLIGDVPTPMPPPAQRLTQVRTEVPLVRPSTDASSGVAVPVRKKVTTRARPVSGPRLVRAPERKTPGNERHTTFAGGSRMITWNPTNR